MSTAAPEDWSLFEHLAFLMGRWWLLLAGLVLCGGGGYLAGNVLGRHAKAVGLLRVGSAYSIGPIAKPADVAARVSSPAFLGSVVAAHPTELPGNGRGVSLSATVPEATNLVQLSATAPTTKEAAAVVALAARRIVADHAQISTRMEKLASERISQMEQRAVSLHAQADQLAKAGRAATDATTRAFVETRWQAALDDIRRLEAHVYDTRLKSAPAANPPTALVDGPTAHIESAKRKAAMLGSACGLVLGGFLAYFLAFLRRRRTSDAKTTSPVTPVDGGRAAGHG